MLTVLLLGLRKGPASCQTSCLGWLTGVRVRLPHEVVPCPADSTPADSDVP